ncbi:hypothetical protein PTKU64_30690 [Paraburkholderia terrae]|uniref:Glycosyltransferase family 9 protein n=1 Tax=Paraburkholderia terrae TaxID=311230 RepID=A0ABM7TWS0_9BURK|nr:glycosyltransferase family 9 protein [Paraburkholderia terrae]BCZ79394.1 hypothetical protein PTKU64_30690 [Paraburkholderia terrae]
MKINIGCGSNYMQGWLNIDPRQQMLPDLVMDPEQTPWPLDDGCAHEVVLNNVLERSGQNQEVFFAMLKELYRICKPDAVINVRVRHPRHNAFLSDPTYVRPILPELFLCLSLTAVEEERQNPTLTPLARDLQVDFEIGGIDYQLSPHWKEELSEGRIDRNALMHALDTYSNVAEWIDIRLQARKPFSPGRSLRKFDAICLDERDGGMGDVLMALGAAKSLKAVTGRPVFIVTAPPWQELARACPHIDGAATDVSVIRDRYANLRYEYLNWPPNIVISRRHQIDSYLRVFGVTAEPALKNVELNLSPRDKDEAERLIQGWPLRRPGQARVLLHIGQKDPNRSWRFERWEALAKALVAEGHHIVLIGSGERLRNPGPIAGIEGVSSALNMLSPKGTVALMRQSDVLVAADSGPVQLAGASDIGIVGLYSVVAGSCRLPFRHGVASWRAEAVDPSCRFFPCYRHMEDPAVFAPYNVALQNRTISLAKVFTDWCLDNGSFACMTQQITVPMVLDAIRRVVVQPVAVSA